MDEKELERLKKLDEMYRHANTVCSPAEFAFRRDNFLNQLAEYLLRPLRDIQLEEGKKKSELVEKFFANQMGDSYKKKKGKTKKVSKNSRPL